MQQITGIFGFWKFPIINKFIGPKYSINDHKVTSGKPNYISNYEIYIDGDSAPFAIEFMYDTMLKTKWFDNSTGRLLRESPEVKRIKGQRFVISQRIIDDLRENMQHMVLEQLEPR